MVVKTRSYYSNQSAESAHSGLTVSSSSAESISITAPIVGRRRVRITTPSFREASTRTYKVYTPHKKPKTRKQQKPDNTTEHDEYLREEDAAAEALMTLQEGGGEGGSVLFATHPICLNPLSPIEKYIYRICVYDFDRTTHLKTAYILYDTKSRLYYVYSIIRVLEHGNLLQLKYTSFVCETITNYIMTLIIPSNPFDYYIQDDIIGVVMRGDDADRDFGNNIFGNESSFYDVEGMIYNTTPTTTSVSSVFMLMPSRHFWYSRYSSSDNMRYYTIHTLDSAMRILSQSH